MKHVTFAILFLQLTYCSVMAEQPLPFPQNRVHDFYANQAQKYLETKKPIPAVLPEFPGLDGGGFGHWGQNPESDNFDYSLNDVKYGGLLSQVVKHFGKTTTKAVCIQLGKKNEYTALFDPEKLTFTDVWQGGFVKWGSSRFGITAGVSSVGKRVIDLTKSQWNIPKGKTSQYLGFYRNDRRVVFFYHIGEVNIYDHLWLKEGKLHRYITIDGKLPASVKLVSNSIATTYDHTAANLTKGGAARWANQTVVTQSIQGKKLKNSPYAIDTITIPYNKKNPFLSPMRIGGFDFLPDGRAVVATFVGDIWLVDGISENLHKTTWKRIAAGLHQPLGLVVQKGRILVLGRDQITRLHDLNEDDEIDFYQCVTNDFPTAAGNSFALTLHQDRNNTLYWFTRSQQFGVTKFTPGEKPKSIATGLRGTNGTGVSSDGKIVFSTVQEGSWTPASAIFEVGGGSYHGFFGPKKQYGSYGYQMPLCFIPRGIDNSCGDIAFLPEDKRLGPLSGKMIGSSYGYCSHYIVLREKIGDSVQGGVIPLPGEFLSGVHRSRYNPHDGHFYLAGTDGWQSYAKENGSLQRIRYVKGDLHLPTAVKTYENGLVVRFNCKLDANTTTTKNVFCQQWNYLYSKAYGSTEFSVSNPARRGHDYVKVRSVHLLKDQKSVFIEIPHLHPVMQLHLYMDLKTSQGTIFRPDLYYSIFKQNGQYKDFPNYKQITRKKRYPKFPIAEKYPRDPRLVAQESLGKTIGNVVSVNVNAIPGLQYSPRQLRIPPNRRIALTIRNTDMSMPHNFVLVQEKDLQEIGEKAMLLASDPRAIATHYVPQHPGVICLSPILNPGEQYTIYFNSPKKKGTYRFVCTFPGHWQVMQGVLYVLDKSDPTPKPPADLASVRKFVKMWKLSDLIKDADQLSNRSYLSGQKMFTVAGCIKCHQMNSQGTNLGPDLSKVRERFKGSKLLKQILQPSTEIHKDYQAYAVLSDDGTTTVGLKVKENKQIIELLPNPLKPSETITIEKNEIEDIVISKTSTMPKGLLMTLSKQEILNLLAYLESGGDQKNKMFNPK